MGYTEVRDWMDKLVDNFKERQTLEDFCSGITLCRSGYIQMHKGIEVIADIMGLEIEEIYIEGHVHLTTKYRDVEIWQVGKSDEVGKR